MSLQYISDSSGHPTAVIIPIEDWNGIRLKYPDVEQIEGDMPEWQKSINDSRLKKISDDPSCLRPLDGLIDELNSDE